jgi:thiamine biosynthesis lipoprotein
MRRVLASLLLMLFLGGCDRPTDYHAESYVFGTQVDIQIFGAPQSQAKQAADAVFSYYDSLHHILHSWQPGALFDLNQSIEKGEPAATVPDVLEMIRLSTKYYRLSGGLFDPAIGKLVAMWGFHSDLPVAKPPTDEQIRQVLAQLPGMDDYQIQGNVVSSNNRQDWLDFGGIAKGWIKAWIC